MSESVCAEQAFSPETYLISLLVSVSGKTTHGLNVLASSKSISAYEMMITTSPTTQRRAAGPFRHTAPLPRSP